MKRRMFPKHSNDEDLLAYLDGEIPSGRIRTIRNHLRSCWRCRFVLADLESQAEAISRTLSEKLDSDIDRTVKAKEKFLQWRASIEKHQKFFRKSKLHIGGQWGGSCSCPNKKQRL